LEDCSAFSFSESVTSFPRLISAFSREHSRDQIIGENAALKSVLEKVECVASTDATVLVLGETGTGKELIAHAIHNLSSRREGPFKIYRSGCNPSCCEFYRSRSSNVLGADERINWISDSWLPRTGIWRKW
jgi:transcriptional regulator of acetoin/glycerol metabolism